MTTLEETRHFLTLDHGRVLTIGSPEQVTHNPQVVEAYLGKKWVMAGAAN